MNNWARSLRTGATPGSYLFFLSAQGLLFLCVSPTVAQVPTATITGVITDSVSAAYISGVSLIIQDLELEDRTGTDGSFRISGITAGTHVLLVRRLGFGPRDFRFTISSDELRELDLGAIPLAPMLTELEPITVVEDTPNPQMAGFHRRLLKGWGHFVTRTDIEARSPMVGSDLLRGIPGVRVVCKGRKCTPTMLRNRRIRGARECPVQYFLDGLALEPGSSLLQDQLSPSLRFSIDDVPPNQIEGIEVYSGRSQTPALFSTGRTNCGVIAIWTRQSPPSPPDTTALHQAPDLPGRQ